MRRSFTRFFLEWGVVLLGAFVLLFLFGGVEGFFLSLAAFPLAIVSFTIAVLIAPYGELRPDEEPEPRQMDLRDARSRGLA